MAQDLESDVAQLRQRLAFEERETARVQDEYRRLAALTKAGAAVVAKDQLAAERERLAAEAQAVAARLLAGDAPPADLLPAFLALRTQLHQAALFVDAK